MLAYVRLSFTKYCTLDCTTNLKIDLTHNNSSYDATIRYIFENLFNFCVTYRSSVKYLLDYIC